MANSEIQLWCNDVGEYFSLTREAKIRLYFASLRAKKLFGMQYLHETFSIVKSHYEKSKDDQLKELMWSLKTNETYTNKKEVPSTNG